MQMVWMYVCLGGCARGKPHANSRSLDVKMSLVIAALARSGTVTTFLRESLGWIRLP